MTLFIVTISDRQTVTTRSHKDACAVIARQARQGVHATFRTAYVLVPSGAEFDAASR